MEGFKCENSREGSKSGYITLENKEIQFALVGRPVKAGVIELLKIFAIMNNIVKSGIRNEIEAGKIILDLFDQLNVQIFEPEQIFTHSIMLKLLESNKIEGLFVEINDGPIVIESGSSLDTVMDNWRKSLLQKKQAEKIEDEQYNRNKQEEVDQLFSQIRTLDFNDLDAIIEWLNKYNNSIEELRSGNAHIDEIIKEFEKLGYRIENNDGIDFTLGEVLKDKKRIGIAIIVYMLDNLGVFNEGQIKMWVQDWKKL